MMKTLSGFQSGLIQIGLSIVLILPSFTYADAYSDYQTNFDKDFSQAESLLGPLSQDGITADSLDEQVKAAIRKKQDLATQNQKELDLRHKLQKWTDKNDKVRQEELTFPSIINKALQDRETSLEDAQNLTDQLGQTQNNLNPADFNLSDLPNACTKSVDMGPLQQILSTMNSQPFQYLQQQASSLLDDKVKENKKKQQEKIADALKYYHQLANQEQSDDQLLSEAFKADNSVEARITKLKAANAQAKSDNKTLKNDLVDQFGKFVTELNGIQDNDHKLKQLANDFANQLQNMRNEAMQIAQDNVDQLLKNCNKQIEEVNTVIGQTGNALAPIVGAQVAASDTQAQQLRANQLRCTDVSNNVQALLTGDANGSQLTSRINQIRSEKSPTRLIGDAVLAMQDVGNMEQQIGSALRPLEDDCQQAADAYKAVKQRAQPVLGANGQAAQQQQFRSPRGAVPAWNALSSGATNFGVLTH